MASIREELEAHFEGLDETAVDPVVQTDTPVVELANDTPAEPQDSRARDEAGRFAPKVREAAESAPAAPVVQVDAPQRPEPPKSWKPEQRAMWETLDPKVAEYVNQREEEMNRGVEPLKKVWNVLTPYMGAIQQTGQPVEAVVGDLMKTAHDLKYSDAQTKFAIWMRIGQAYGVSAQAMQQIQEARGEQSQVDPNVAHLMNEVNQLRGNLTSFQQQQQQAEQQAIEAHFSQFAQTHPHFEAVRQTMGTLMTQGIAPDLESAYQKALRLNDDLWTQQQTQQRDADERTRRESADKAAKAARASAVSPRSATPGAAVTVNGANGRRAVLEEAFSQHANRI